MEFLAGVVFGVIFTVVVMYWGIPFVWALVRRGGGPRL